MSSSERTRDPRLGSRYVLSSFEPTDRLAVVVTNKRTGSVIQRIASADKIAAEAFQAWLRHQNTQYYEIYISMNALRQGARSRTKADVAVIRHVHLDFDENAPAALEALLKREDLRTPSSVVNTSAGKWQVVWRVTGFTKNEAEDF